MARSLTAIALFCVAARAAFAQNGIYHGRSRQLVAVVPRFDTTVTIAGELTEDVWRRAAVLTGFSSYLPLDNRPAQDSTEVLIWYTATDVYFGVRAFESPGLYATLTARARIDSDDYVQLLIDPFNDRWRAFVFSACATASSSSSVICGGVRASWLCTPTLVRRSLPQ